MPNVEDECLMSSREITFNGVILTKNGNRYVRIPTTNNEKESKGVVIMARSF